MRITELRSLLGKYDKENLNQIVIDLYKSIPKKMRDEKEIDTLLEDFQKFKKVKKRNKAESITINELEREINQFVQDAYDQNYYAPNQHIKKKDRPKWRFKVKAYIKQLQQIPADETEGRAATDLLKKLYDLLCYGCGYYIFNTENPFRSVGIEQAELLDMLLKRNFSTGISRETINATLKLSIHSELDRETLRSSLINVFISNLKTADAKEMAVEQCMQLRVELKEQKAMPAKDSWDHSEYERQREMNDLVETVLRLRIELCDYESGIGYFKKNFQEQNKEILLFVLLEILKEFNQKDYWLNEYESAVKEGVTPRPILQDSFRFLKENGRFARDLTELI